MLTFSVATRADAAVVVLDFVRVVARDFARAMRLGFFGPGVAAVPVVVQLASPTLVLVHMHTDAIHPAVLRILRGMCEWGRLARDLPLRWLGPAGQQAGATAIGEAASALAAKPQQAFMLQRPDFVGFGEQLVVVLNLDAPPDEQQSDLLDAGFECWIALMQGGLPPEPYLPGESTVGATQTMRIGSTTCQWFLEGVIAHEACLDLLTHFLVAHADALRIRDVEIEV